MIEKRRVACLTFERVLRQEDPMCLIRDLGGSADIHTQNRERERERKS